jgi:hypothetical protein
MFATEDELFRRLYSGTFIGMFRDWINGLARVISLDGDDVS